MVLTSRVKVVSSVKVCVRTAHLVISQPENVMTGVVYIGLGHIVKVFGNLVLLIFAGHKLYLRTISFFKRDICASNLSYSNSNIILYTYISFSGIGILMS